MIPAGTGGGATPPPALSTPLFFAASGILVVGQALTIDMRLARDCVWTGWTVQSPDRDALLVRIEVSAESIWETLGGAGSLGVTADEPTTGLPIQFHGWRVPMKLRQGTTVTFVFADGGIAGNTRIDVMCEAYRQLQIAAGPAAPLPPC